MLESYQRDYQLGDETDNQRPVYASLRPHAERMYLNLVLEAVEYLLDGILLPVDGQGLGKCQVHVRDQAEESLPAGDGGRPKAITETGLDYMLVRLCRRAGVRPRGHHANRRGVARLIYDETKDLVATQSFLGHADPKTTEIYIGMDLGRQKKAQDVLRRRLSNSIPSNLVHCLDFHRR